jgi:hypothetical protein
MARLRRMYARLLFVVVGIFGAFSSKVGSNPGLFWLVLALSAPLFWACALASPGAADIRWRHE